MILAKTISVPFATAGHGLPFAASRFIPVAKKFMTRFALVFLLAFTSISAQAMVVPSPPQIAAKAYLLVDASSGAVLAEHNADMPLPPASLTKMMTSYILAREISEGNIKETDMVTISENAWSQNPLFAGSSLMWIEPGMDVSIEDLQRGIIISSGNDATVAVAEHVAGSEAVFVEMMNTQAEKLGMVDTYYVNTHGLPHPDHVTTARDLALLSKAMINDHPEQYAIYKEREFTYNDIRQYNRNTLLAEDPTVDGLKTGHTEEAGYCLVASAERRGMRLISVVMGTSSKRARKNQTSSLLNYGFRFYETSELYAPLTELDKPRVWKGQVDYVSAGVNLVTTVSIDDEIIAPLAVGDAVGTVTLTLDGETVHHAPVVALEAVEPGSFFSRLWDMLLMWIASLFSA
jgi:D-alanyl-D-alanine carboxypeptidase (penicillin-binding protein 5/6)